MRRVLLLLPGAFSNYGGIEMYGRLLIRAFLELGLERDFEVTTLVLNDDEADVDDRYLPKSAERPTCFRRGKAAFAVGALWRARLGRPDLVVFGHIHFARLARWLKVFSPESRIWCVVYGIDVWTPLSRSIRKGVTRIDRFLSISNYSREELAKNGDVPGDRIGLLPCAIDPVWQERCVPWREERVRIGGETPTLLTVARLVASERYKGVDSVIRSLPNVLEAVPEVRYDVVGEGDDRRRLEALSQELGVAANVRFRGRLRPEELAAAYRDCTLFVMPSSHEGFGIVFLEAALFGKTSIAGRHRGSPEVVEDGKTGLLRERDDVRGISDAIVRLLLDRGLREEMGRAAAARLDARFTYRHFRETLEAAIANG